MTCRSNAKCYTEGCYSRKAYRLYKNTKKAWNSNWEFYKEDPAGFFDELNAWLIAHKPKLFRWHVSGDVPDQFYLESMMGIAMFNPIISFLCYTKRYEFDFSGKPDNLQIVLSTWPTMELPENKSLPWAWIEGDVRIPEDAYYFRCPGGCKDCPEQICWNKLDNITHIVFPFH